MKDLHLPQPRGVHVQGDGGLFRSILNPVDADFIVGVCLRRRIGQPERDDIGDLERPTPPNRSSGVGHSVLEELAVHLGQLVLHLHHVALHSGHPAGAFVVAVDEGLAPRGPAHKEHFHLLRAVDHVARVLGGVMIVPVHKLLVLLPPREPLCNLVAHAHDIVLVMVGTRDAGPEVVDQGVKRVCLRHECPRAAEARVSSNTFVPESSSDARGNLAVEAF
mmetsp:Transcript_21124/g.56920  ORF Transcript_21124/g.56920 Transcript_21124/m.56920 type:complete len:220 (+) Transcript_21124:299-958(+)